MSLTPVREALQRLEAEGLIAVRPRSGTVVLPIDVLALHEGQLLMVALMSEVVERLAGRPKALGDVPVDDDARFFSALLRAEGAERLWGRLAGYRTALERCRMLDCGSGEDRLPLRRDVLARVRAGDRNGARAAVRTIVSEDLARLGAWRAAHPEMFSEA